MKKTVILISISISIMNCVERVSRPNIKGYLYDSITLNKIDSATIVTWNNHKKIFIIETLSDQGEFFLNQKTYLDNISIGTEVPTEFYSFIINKKGYNKKRIEAKNRFGFEKDTVLYDSIFLTPSKKNLK